MVIEMLDKIKYISLLISVIGTVFSAYVLFKHNFDTSSIILCLLWIIILVKDVSSLFK